MQAAPHKPMTYHLQHALHACDRLGDHRSPGPGVMGWVRPDRGRVT